MENVRIAARARLAITRKNAVDVTMIPCALHVLKENFHQNMTNVVIDVG